VRAVFTDSACLARLDAGGVSLLQYPATELEAGPANLWLRRHDAGSVAVVPLLGPGSPSSVAWTDAGPVVAGAWEGLEYLAAFALADDAPRWTWTVEVSNTGGTDATVDVVHTFDPALAPYGAVRTNEFYVSQYLDISPVDTERHGTALAVRQNMPGPTVPWLVLTAHRSGAGWATDGLQLVGEGQRGPAFTALAQPALPSRRLQHEHSLVALQDAPATLEPGGRVATGFTGCFAADHPAASGPPDASTADAAATDATDTAAAAAAVAAARASSSGGARTQGAVTATLFSHSPAVASLDLDEDELASVVGSPAEQHVERDDEGRALAWFTDDGAHVVTASKERAVLRPHGHILRTGDALVPDTAGLTSTVWMSGTFHSQVTRGHVGRDRILSTRRGYLGLNRAHGLRVFVEEPGSPTGWALLETPSAWSVAPQQCRWWYAAEWGTVEVTSSAPTAAHELGLEVRWLRGTPRRLLVAAHVSLGGDDGQDQAPLSVTVAPDSVRVSAAGSAGPALEIAVVAGGLESVDSDAPLFADSRSRRLPWLALTAQASPAFALCLTAAPADTAGEDRPEPGQHLGAAWEETVPHGIRIGAPDASGLAGEVSSLDTVLPWFAHNALVHYLSPRGLEQYSGGAWGTRDVCQGPVGVLTALGRRDELRDVLLRVLRAQNARGDWPQAFEFLPPAHSAGQHDSHGDVVFWPLLAVGDYLQTTADASLLGERVPLVGDDGPTEAVAVVEHLRRALERVRQMRVPGTPLPAYGHGDWNDSLQPADPRLAAQMVSTWTTVLLVQALRSLAAGLRACGVEPDLAAEAEGAASAAHAALTDVLLVDGVLPGYAVYAEDGGEVEPLVHPRDQRTGLTHGVLPWIHAITADLLSPQDAQRHLELIDEHLLGPDGARLFDRPVRYSGGPMSVFQRAESSTFWGREIGLMYMHAHLRYAEALARFGDAPGLFAALTQAVPVGITDRVPQARPRQSTTYYSSSDGVFADRSDASARYADLMRGEVALEGGWRVYSSGPGLFLRLVTETLLGVRLRGDRVEVDPVLDARLDGLTACMPLGDRRIRVTYRVGADGSGTGAGVAAVEVRGRAVETTPLSNPYRAPGVSVALDDLVATDGTVEVTVVTR
jgi:CRISPR-associated protein Csx3